MTDAARVADAERSLQPPQFFVSYTQSDREWAEWIAWQLEAAGPSVVIQAWDMVPGSNWLRVMNEASRLAERTIVVLSAAYLRDSAFGELEWQAALRRDPRGLANRLIPIRVDNCVVDEGLPLAGIVHVDLFGLPPERARQRLLGAVRAAQVGRAKPELEPMFPGAELASGSSSATAVTGTDVVEPEPAAPQEIHRTEPPKEEGNVPDRDRPEGRSRWPKIAAVGIPSAIVAVALVSFVWPGWVPGGQVPAGPTQATSMPGPAMPRLRIMSLPNTASAPKDVAAAQDGTAWVTEFENGRIGHVSADGRLLGELDTPSSGARLNHPYAITERPQLLTSIRTRSPSSKPFD